MTVEQLGAAPEARSRTATVIAACVRYTWPTAIVVAAAAAAARGWLAMRIPVPWIMTDELIYRELADSFAHTGHLTFRGESIGLVSLYPVVLAPLWRAGSVALAYDLSKVVNVLAMTTTSLLVFLWGQRVVGLRYAAAAFGLSLLMPAFLYTGEIMSENLAMPAFVLAAFAVWLALKDPRLARQAAALGAVGLLCVVRLEGVVLVPIWVTSIALAAAFTAESGRGRAVLRAFRPYWPSAAVALVVAAAYLLATLARGRHPLGFYQGALNSPYSAGSLALWFAYHLAELSIAVGLVPAAALLLALRAAARRRLDPGQAGLVAVTAASVAWLAAVAGTWASWHGDGIRERYAFYAVPLVLLTFVVFLERAAPSRRVALAAGLVACVAPVALPLPRLLGYGVLSKAPSLDGLRWLTDRSSLDAARPVLAAFAVAAVAVLVLRFRHRAAVAVAFVAGVFLVNTIAGTALAEDLSGRIMRSSQASSWVDRRLGAGADVGVVWTGSVDPNWLWQVEFWNRSVRRVYYVGQREPGLLPVHELAFDRSGEVRVDGRPLPVQAVVTALTFRFDAPVLAWRPNALALVRMTPATRATLIVTGLYGDSWTGPVFTYTKPGCHGVSRLIFVFRSRSAAPPQTVVARQAGRVVGRGRVRPGGQLFLRAPLTRADECTLQFEITPTWIPAESVAGSSDTRSLGLIYQKVVQVP